MAGLRALRVIAGVITAAIFLVLGAATLEGLDQAYPPPIVPPDTSVEVVDRDGAILRAFAAGDGTWRFDVSLDDVDPAFLEMLIAYEDKRFFRHHGLDPLAIARASLQLVTNGRIVSGASTLTMQVARLMEPRSARSLTAKLRQMARAFQLERRLTKREILELYLTLAPYGGNLEGIRAASLAWFGKEPKRLSVGEAALLVALPQLPERRRPDRNLSNAQAARERVLDRLVSLDLMEPAEAVRASREPVPAGRIDIPLLAAHEAERAVRAAPDKKRHQLTLNRRVQEQLEQVARDAARTLGPRLSVAMVMADARTGEVVAHVGSAGYFDPQRSGWIDMTRAMRSPGSTLKPFIYALAMEEGLAAQETMIEDRPADFGGYRPRNFDLAYQGDVSVRHALQMSLNVPAVRLLDAVGPARLAESFRRGGARLVLPRGEAPGLAIALGGAGITLWDLVQLYTAFPAGGVTSPLRTMEGNTQTTRILEAGPAWQVADILLGIAPPEGALPGIGYKTGTSYGYRDAWAIGFDGRHVLGVWVGRPDGGAVPGLSGYVSAAPILFEAFARSSLPVSPLAPPPPGSVRTARAELPVTLRRFGATAAAKGEVMEAAPRIVFPPDNARIELGGAVQPLVLKLQGGRAPFRWLANGAALSGMERRRTSSWTPDGAGFSRLTVIDAAGRTASVGVYIE